MEIHNYTHGVKVLNPVSVETKGYFYGKKQARLSLGQDGQFGILDDKFYQIAVGFKRTDITAIFNNGIAVPLPGTDALFFDLLSLYLYTEAYPVAEIVPINGVNYDALLTDNGKTFLFDLPGSPKTFTIPSGLPIGWRCEVVKMYPASTLTVVGSGGMIVSGLDLVLNGQYAKMQILVTGVNSALAFNIGG